MSQNRKDAVRAYHERKRPMGVFRVGSEGGTRSVIGSSVDLRAALNRQRAQLQLASHPDTALQAEWDELGADAFTFEVLDVLEPTDDPGYDPTEDLKELEAMWRERLVGT